MLFKNNASVAATVSTVKVTELPLASSVSAAKTPVATLDKASGTALITKLFTFTPSVPEIILETVASSSASKFPPPADSFILSPTYIGNPISWSE